MIHEDLEEKDDSLNQLINELDGVGPVDNRPSTDKLHNFVWKKNKKKHVTRDAWHVTHDTWHVWGGGEHSLKMSAP